MEVDIVKTKQIELTLCDLCALCGGNMFENNVFPLQLFITAKYAKSAKWSYDM